MLNAVNKIILFFFVLLKRLKRVHKSYFVQQYLEKKQNI